MQRICSKQGLGLPTEELGHQVLPQTLTGKPCLMRSS